MIKINEAAAESDISNIEKAKNKLDDSLASIKRLEKISAAMHSETGAAITEQCGRLEKMIGDLQKNLSLSQKVIRDVVREYLEQDKNHAKEIRMKGC